MHQILEFYQGKEIEIETAARRLTAFGYARRDLAEARGEFAVRGGVVDVYPMHFSFPVRIEFDGDVVENIHTFDPATGQRFEPHRMLIVMPFASSGRRAEGPRHFHLTEEAPVEPFVDMEIGDPVVHVLHGIARYRGIKPLKNASGRPEDHFSLEFAEKNILYVPTRDLHLLQKYVSFGKSDPELSRLGTHGWEKLKEKTRRGVMSFASDLLDLQARRKALKGFRFPKDNEWQKRLEQSFPYQETEDQTSAVRDVKADLESAIPMDRLLCGDVGYGKTEVALRAAFKVVTGGKQAAILVPTTLLAEQHYETFTARMKDFPVSVKMLSRFQTKGEQRDTVEALKDGRCDIVIGTHRLLSPDVSFKDLGLVVVDEEQKFGVRHKEHLKKMRLLVDVLTLTATPIPRTLYMSLVGARDMSTINTPPKNRRPVETVVKESDDHLIRDAIRAEMARQGQTFFVHNRVEGIEAVAAKVHHLVPEARVGVGHGQMAAKALESVMRKFIHGELDVLVCTTIVESGIDIPNANTLIVDRADLFGLSELYQLRGRVGRFDRSAHAYLLVPKDMVLTEESARRLRAIERFSYLGSGFHVAMEDLEIRGAGEILGTEQSGYIATVGFDLYCRILREAVAHLKASGKGPAAAERAAGAGIL